MENLIDLFARNLTRLERKKITRKEKIIWFQEYRPFSYPEDSVIQAWKKKRDKKERRASNGGGAKIGFEIRLVPVFKIIERN